MQSVVGRGDILRKINFPKYIIILSAMTSSLISLAINLVVVVIFAVITIHATQANFTALVLLVPLSITQLFLLAFGISLFLSTLYVKFRDIGHIWEVVLQILFYSMPIIYPLTQVANLHVLGVEVQKIIMLNPVAQTIQDIRHNLISPETVPTTWSTIDNPWLVLIPIVLTVTIIGIGAIYFSKNSKKFAENL